VPLASAAFLAAAELYPDTRTLSAAGDHFLAIGQNKPAADWYSRAIDKAAAEKSPHERRLRRQLLNVLLTLTDFDRARTEDENYVKLYPGDPFGLLMRAELEFRGGHVDEAIRITDGIIEKDTTYADAIFARARFQLTIGRWDRAIADLERLKAMAPEYRGLTPRRTLSYLYERTGQMEKAEFELRSLAERYPEMPEAADALIDFYKRQQRSGDAQHVATTWINRLPEDIRQAPWYLKRAELLLQTNDHARALEDLQKACELTKNDPRTVAAYLGVCQRLNRVDEGIKFYEAHSTDETRTPDLRVAYANILVRKGDLDGAVREYRAAVSGGRPEDLVQALAVARAAATAMGAARALELFRVTPDDPAQVLPNEFIVAALTSLSGDRSAAIEQLKGLLAKAEHDLVRWNVSLQIGSLCAEEGDNQAARHYYEETLRLNPNSLAGLNNLAYVLTDALHEPLKAIPYARKAVQLAPIAEVHDTLGWAYFKAGQLDEALGALSQAVQLDPELTAAVLHLADVYRCRGDFARAAGLLRDTLQRIEKTPEEAKYQQQITDALKRVEQKDTKP
jgi:tetratricopeptide (TPR) repeat protein